MTLPVTPSERTLHPSSLIVDKERRRGTPAAKPSRAMRFVLPLDEPTLDSTAPVSVDAGTGAAVSELDPVDAVPLATAIARYGAA